MKRIIAFTFEGKSIEVVAERVGNLLTVTRGDQVYRVELEAEHSAPAEQPGANPATETASPPPSVSERPSASIVATGGSGAVPAPMTGTIKEVLVHVGDTVQENEQIIMMEAMKMDIEVAAPRAGKVTEIMVGPGDNVRENQTVLRIE
jgi:glutaconyl-CoA/methylmalonyl-CoA decarboxylase subunit gamma